MPLIDYVVLGGRDQLQNRRNTISYDKEHKRDVLDEALKIYETFASKLSWPEYFKLVKRYLFKLQRVDGQIGQVSSHGDPELQKEKLVTKVICKILNGFSFQAVPDAIDALIKQDDERAGGR